MYKPKMRSGSQDAIPPMKKKFATSSFECKCNRHIKVGELIYFDGWTNNHLCLSCGNLSSVSKVVAPSQQDDWQRGYDRMRALENLPGPLKPHLQKELNELKQTYGNQGSSNSQEGSKIISRGPDNEWLHGMYAKFAGNCDRCRNWQKIGTYVAFHRVRRVIICANCL